MPITPLHPIHRIAQDDFREIAYTVMGHVFRIHSEYGRLFNECIYKQELASRMSGVELEFPIFASHGNFTTTYYLDALVANSAVFEFKAAESLTSQHRGQLYNYLLLTDLSHGKLVNLRPESVQHEFVNSTLEVAGRYRFEIFRNLGGDVSKDCDELMETTVSLLKDWGAGLELHMYEAAITALLGGADRVVRHANVRGSRQIIGQQSMHFAGDDIVFKLTAFKSPSKSYEDHARCLLRNIDVRSMLWINIDLKHVTFTQIHEE